MRFAFDGRRPRNANRAWATSSHGLDVFSARGTIFLVCTDITLLAAQGAGEVPRKHLAVPDAGLLFDQVVVLLGQAEIGPNPSESTSAFRISGEFLRVTTGLCSNVYFSERFRS